MPTVRLRPTKAIGRRCVAAWKVGDEFVRVDITPEDYDKLRDGGVPPGAPTREAVFIGASEHPLFDTPSGRLESGCIVDKPEGYMIVKTGTGAPKEDRILVRSEQATGTKETLTVAAPIRGVTVSSGFIIF